MTFGAVAVTAGMSLAQAMVLSVVMFTGASQFAFAGVIASGGSPVAAIPAALLLGVRNAFYGVPLTELLRPRGLARLWTGHFVIDETTAMATAQTTPPAGRYAFWATGLVLFVLWNAGTLAGALLGTAVDPAALGLDAAAPAIFLALLVPHLARPATRRIAVLGALVAIALIPIAPAGVPVVAAAAVAIAGGLLGRSDPDRAPAGPDGADR